ncbi:tetratricopeptide repeat protein [Desulfocurvibacter africanus]|uniref:Tetratricopeptide domain-containing protein n=1 Tax=Desulfocurvibacter africanus subsp. africanus str. Walvis Bay TaxID=690850 RepID=F3Z2K5_DESAF|nr:tetratricopeptide repeat protein [Desulfocurvibacter africanus]EGJ51338.1 tetratricopeptide domain-containing protein [Desulfocurvibacter africanus subsp. africanus str. Walvis Bay]
MFWLFRRKCSKMAEQRTEPTKHPGEGQMPPSQDTLAAIGELSRVVKNNPDSVEIYLALGNLYRSQGEIERAVQIRNNLIVRPGLDKEFKIKALYELGRDYKRAGFVDRARAALEEAQALGGRNKLILSELARLAADGGDYEQAATLYSQLDHPQAEAHYLVQFARELFDKGVEAQGKKTLKKALRVYPGSLEAWLVQLTREYDAGDKDRLRKTLSDALAHVRPELSFILFEGLLSHATKGRLPDSANARTVSLSQTETELLVAVLNELESRHGEILLHYYGALILALNGRPQEASTWLERALLLDPTFWPARLDLLGLSLEEQNLSPLFHSQLEFFINKARSVKRFACGVCGLKQSQLFFVCARCGSWHSIVFRMLLTD